MTIECISIISEAGQTDTIFLRTNLPQGVWPFESEGQMISFEVVAGGGVEYVEKHFPGIEYKHLDLRKVTGLC
jgi:hypothetical protein